MWPVNREDRKCSVQIDAKDNRRMAGIPMVDRAGCEAAATRAEPQALMSNVIRTCNNANSRRRLLIPSLIGALIAPLCILTTAAGAIPASGSPAECWVATAPPAGFYIAAILSTGHGCTDHYRWKLGVPKAGVTECWVTSAPPPAGFYIAAILGASPSCLGHYRWKLGVAAAGVAECWASTAPPAGFYIAAILSTGHGCTDHYRWKLGVPAAGVTDCWVTTVAAPPAGFYIAGAVTSAHWPGCFDHAGWKLGVPAAGVAECWVTSAPPPAGFYIAAILGVNPGCLGHYRWKLDVAASPSPSPSTSPTPSLGLTAARAVKADKKLVVSAASPDRQGRRPDHGG
jgi:hypothetical protein